MILEDLTRLEEEKLVTRTRINNRKGVYLFKDDSNIVSTLKDTGKSDDQGPYHKFEVNDGAARYRYVVYRDRTCIRQEFSNGWQKECSVHWLKAKLELLSFIADKACI